MKIKLIACDLDGTLLNSAHCISERNAAAVRRALASGLIFLPASGRMFRGVLPTVRQLGLDVPLVCYNGALVRGSVSEKIYYEHKLSLATARRLLAYCREHDFYVQSYLGDACYVKEATDFSRYYGSMNKLELLAIGDEVYEPWEAPYKLLIVTSDAQFAEVMALLKQEFAAQADLYISQKDYIEVMEPGAGKWQAVKSVAAGYGITPGEILCIGDSDNDAGMVAAAGLGVAVANATRSVLKAAKVITASNDDDGVALIIENILTEQAVE